MRILRGPRFTTRFEKTASELMSYQVDIQKILEANSVKDDHLSEDFVYYYSRPLPTLADLDRVRDLLDSIFTPEDAALMSVALDALGEKYKLFICTSRSMGERCRLPQGHEGNHLGRTMQWDETEET